MAAQVPRLMPLLCQSATRRGWTVGQTFLIRYCRVGILNEIGELLAPRVVVLLIGERPGLATADGISPNPATISLTGRSTANSCFSRGIPTFGIGYLNLTASVLLSV